MAGLAILKHTYDLSDEVLCERWLENPYYQFFCGEEFFQHEAAFRRLLGTGPSFEALDARLRQWPVAGVSLLAIIPALLAASA